MQASCFVHGAHSPWHQGRAWLLAEAAAADFQEEGLRFFPQLTSVFVTTANGAGNCRGLARTGNLIPSLLVIHVANCPPWAPNLCSVSRGRWGRWAAWP